MHRRTLLASAAVALAGCSGDDGSGGEAQDTTDITQRETSFDTAAVSFEGSGGTLTDTFTLAAGFTTIEAMFDSDDIHSIDVIRPDGSSTGQHWVGRSNAYYGEQATAVDGGDYTLDISTAGDWQIGIHQPRPTDAPAVPAELSGSGDSVRGPFSFAGVYDVSLSNNQGQYLHSEIYSPNGERTSIASNIQTSDETRVNYQGIGFVVANLAESWTISFA